MRTPIRLPLKAYAMLAFGAAAGTATLALTCPPDRVIGLMFEADEEFGRAILFFNAWNAKHPTDYEARWHTIELLLETARPEEALAALQDMSAKWPDDSRVVARLAEVYDGLLDVERSMSWTEKLAKLRPQDPLIIQRLLNYYRWFGKSEALIAGLERLVEISPSPEEHRELTDLLISHHRIDELLAFNAKYIQSHPDAVEPHLALYQGHLHENHPDLALRELKEVMRLEPEGQDSDVTPEEKIDLADKLFELRVQELVASGDTEAAITLYRARIEQNPTNVPLRLRLSELYGDKADAIAADELKKVVELAPKSYAAQRALGFRLSWLGRTREAKNAFARAVAIEPDKIGTRRALAEQLTDLDLSSDAIPEWKWIVAHGGTAQDRAQLVAALIELGRNTDAVTEAKLLVKRAPSRSNYRLLARAAIAAKQCGAVLVELKELTRRFAEDSEAWSLFGLCAKQQGLTEEAVEALDKAAKLHGRGAEPTKVRAHGR